MMTYFSNCFDCSLIADISITRFFIVLVAFYWWLACRQSHKAVLQTGPFSAWDALIATLLIGWFLSVIIGSFEEDQNISLSVILLSSATYFFIVGGICAFLSLRHLSPIKLFGLAPSHPRKIIITACLWLLVTYPLIMASQGVTEALFGTNNDIQAVVIYFLNHHAVQERIAIILMAVVVAPCAEEFLFRGYLYGVLRRFLGRIPAIIVTSLLFAAVHLNLSLMLGLALLAVMLCLLYERTGSLWSNICVHAMFNSISIIMLLVFQKEFS